MLRICVDSNSQLPRSLARRFDIATVPLAVTIDGVEYHEGVDLDADRFYDFWRDGRAPEVTTSQPSPGDFIEVYERLLAEGATEILSIHIADSLSGTLNSARLAAQRLSIPIRHVDTGIASFGISCCAWAAAEAIADGADLEAAAIVAEERAAHLGTAFVIGIPNLTERSGRVDGLGIGEAAERGIPVIAMSGGEVEVLATVDTVHQAVVAMADYALGWTPSVSGGLRIAVGTSDETSVPVSRSLTELLEHHSDVADVVQYRIGPTVGAHTGPGTAGLFVF
jgi:DegV family protein with EDD domain